MVNFNFPALVVKGQYNMRKIWFNHYFCLLGLIPRHLHSVYN
ncbi:MAG: YqaE/Pmp3 family membrane protein [Okeania sp. SIO2D1]|nr:YqaE/Pmp3 family membrane protein [Okeania sp. SIO2D1]